MIDVERLTKFYGPKKAIDDVSFHVKKGEILGFLGPNAAGKTTTMRVITCYLSASAGTARVNGYDIFNNPIEVKRQIGYLPENPLLYMEMTVENFLTFVGKIRSLSGKELKRRLSDVMDKASIGHVKDRIISRLSKGYKQRVGLAQALLHDPKVLLLDEPTSGLDPKQIIEVRELIKSLAGEHTIILSTHILPEVSMTCGRVVIINEGKIVAQDTPENLTSRIKSSETIQAVIDGPTQDILSTIKSISGVSQVKLSKTEKKNMGVFQLEIQPDKNVRRNLVSAIVSNSWGLYELQNVGMSLEEIFLHLTTSEEV